MINAARRFTEDPHSLHPLNPVWDNRFMSLLEQGRLSELDAIGNDELSAMAGKSTHEIKTWVAAFAALSALAAGAVKAAITGRSPSGSPDSAR